MKLMTIASGSSGNSIFIGSDTTSILLDVGIAAKRVKEVAEKVGIKDTSFDAIFITHEHIDHIKGLGVISRKYNIPIYATYGTIDGIMQCRSLGVFDYNLLRPIRSGASVLVGDIMVSSHAISHDAADPVCYSFECNGRKVSVATDLGVYDNSIIDFLSESDAMVIEANHDVRMLEAGEYPYPLKQRILGSKGHLCNEASGRLIRQLLSPRLRYTLLGHLSDKNNYPELALQAVKNELMGSDIINDPGEIGLAVAPRYITSELYIV